PNSVARHSRPPSPPEDLPRPWTPTALARLQFRKATPALDRQERVGGRGLDDPPQAGRHAEHRLDPVVHERGRFGPAELPVVAEGQQTGLRPAINLLARRPAAVGRAT